jgi:ubiquitin carboxyl-terminal hydrolase 22/27/51
MDQLFTEVSTRALIAPSFPHTHSARKVYQPTNTPYGPITFLSNTWRKSSELSGYAQQDAHEFFISTIHNIHASSRGSTNVSCNCIVHSTFAGSLQSDVKCERCKNVTTTVDLMMDISLELKGGGENTLIGCLRRYTQPEKLGVKDYSCSKCGKTSHVRFFRGTAVRHSF